MLPTPADQENLIWTILTPSRPYGTQCSVLTQTVSPLPLLPGPDVSAARSLLAIANAEFSVLGFRFILSPVQEEVSEFAGPQLFHKKATYTFRVPDGRGRMIHSHSLHLAEDAEGGHSRDRRSEP